MLTIALSGNSLLMSSIGASLREHAEVRLLLLDTILSEAARQLDDLKPDAVILDLSATPSDWTVSVLKSNPNLLLIGVDPAANKALVFSGRPGTVSTADDLVHLIECREGSGAGLSREANGS